MKRWVINIIQQQSMDAVSKPKSDVTAIAEGLGYMRINIRVQNTRDMLDVTLRALIDGATAGVASGDIVLYQFPTLLGFRFEEMFVGRLKEKGAKVIILMHDSEWLRGFYPEENQFLNSVDAVISHGDRMINALKEYGVRTKIIKKELFDYLLESDFPLATNLSKKLVVAGNLDKSIFIENWSQEMPEIQAFGNKSNGRFGENVIYRGSFLPDDLAKVIPKDYFGIAWDDQLPGGGDYQRYTRYNSPHKVSLYLSLGLPVIVWEDASIADFITKHQLGFAIARPDDIKDKIKNLSEVDLVNLKNNVNKIAIALRSGMFTRSAVLEAERVVLNISNM